MAIMADDSFEDEQRINKHYQQFGFTAWSAIGPLFVAAYFLDLKWTVAGGIALILASLGIIEHRLYDLCIRARRTNATNAELKKIFGDAQAELKKISIEVSNLNYRSAEADRRAKRVLEEAEAAKLMEKLGLAAATLAEEQTEFTVILASVGDRKIGVLQQVREITGLGLKEAWELVQNAPMPIKVGVGKDEAAKIRMMLEEAGAFIVIAVPLPRNPL
jgi:large subunit ribosomal protein L7/L12